MLATEENMSTALLCLQDAELIAVDTETTGLNVRNNIDYLRGICLATPDGFLKEGIYLPFRQMDKNLDKKWLYLVWEILKNKPLVWHHRKFDMHSLKTIGLDPLELVGDQYDTMLLFHMWNEEFFSFSMDTLCKVFLKDDSKEREGEELKNFGIKFGFDKIPAEVEAPYGSGDARRTIDLFRYIWPKIKKEELNTVYLNTEQHFTRILYKLEQRGVGVNKEFAANKAEIGKLRMATIYRELHVVNPSSPTQLKKLLIDELGLPVLAHTASCEDCKARRPVNTHDGKPSFNKKIMEDYDDILQAMDNPVAKRVAEYRGWQKAVSSLYDPLLERTGPDGFIRTEFKQHGTVTGRLSASEPNLQQIPRSSDKPWNGNAKSSFSSGHEGYTLIGWDYSQLELRLASVIGNETVLLEEFKKADSDPFAALAPLIFGVFTPETRQDTKTFVYANLYGAGLPKIAAQLGRSETETRILYENYKASIPGITRVSSQVSELVKRRGYARYWDKRRRHFKNKGDSYKAWNSVCQGGGAQLVKQAMIKCEKFEDENCQMVLQVHDEITFIIKTDMIDHYEPMIVKAMTDWSELGDTFSNITFAVDGKAWK